MTSGDEGQELSEVPKTSETNLSPQKQVYHQVRRMVSDHPDKFAVETREKDYLSMFGAHTVLITPEDDEVFLSVSLDQKKSNGEITERFTIQFPEHETIYRLDVMPAGEIAEKWKQEMTRLREKEDSSATAQAFRKMFEDSYEEDEFPLLFVDSFGESRIEASGIIKILSRFKELRFPPKMIGRPSLAQIRKGIKSGG